MPQPDQPRNTTRSETLAHLEHDAKTAELHDTFNRDQLPTGTDVIITITAKADPDGSFTPAQWFVSETGHEHMVDLSDPNASVVVIEPETPTTADILEQHSLDSIGHWRIADPSVLARCLCYATATAGSHEAAHRWHAEHVAAALAEAGRTR